MKPRNRKDVKTTTDFSGETVETVSTIEVFPWDIGDCCQKENFYDAGVVLAGVVSIVSFWLILGCSILLNMR
jgi:hypothetical protein